MRRTSRLADDVDLEEVARTTAGFAGADLENLMNEAAILRGKRKPSVFDRRDIRTSFIKWDWCREKEPYDFREG